MTEAEWRETENLDGMIKAVGKHLSNRKARLFAIECIRRAIVVLHYESLRSVIETAEQDADGHASLDALDRVWRAAAEICNEVNSDPSEQRWYHQQAYAISAVVFALDPVLSGHTLCRIARLCQKVQDISAADGEGPVALRHEIVRQAELLRCLFGNPLRPPSFSVEWLTSAVVALAAGIYEERAFDRMPILADALMDAGCDNADILDHCRGAGPHVRGCWVIDLVLGKE